AAMTGKKIVDEIISFVSNYTQLRTKIDAQSQLHDKVLEKFEKNVRSKFSEIITIDGVKIIVDENTWSLVRKSNTEDIIRISVESNNIQKAKQIQKETISLVKQSYDQIR
ncbi:MAG: phosphomannomutase, partial [Candidatus Nitrosotenuis sp.]